MAGQAYVENFSQDTLDRAERVIKANRVTQQTATTFDAAATLFQLVNIWGSSDVETQQKIKYAKWNAARIAKAIKEGRDPNESNPKLDPDEEPAPSSDTAAVEEVPNDNAPDLVLPDTPAQFQLPSVPERLQPPAQPGYFEAADSLPSPLSPPADEHPPQPFMPNWDPTPEPPVVPAFSPPPTFTAAVAPPSDFMRTASTINTPKSAVPGASPAHTPVAPTGIDEAAMMQAQKHAKWAISALNFEDVQTAVLELRQALETLGAS